MKKSLIIFAATISQLLPTSGFAQQAEPQIDFIHGPATASIANMAEIAIPEGYVFTGREGTQTLMEMYENPITGSEVGFLASKEENWFIVFEFDEIGYVKDNERDQLDAKKMLKSMQQATEAGNKLRRERGWPTIELTGWVKEPFYNPVTNNLEWATKIVDQEGMVSVNYNTRLLGRNGVMAVTLVGDPEELEALQQRYQGLLTAFAYTDGHRYAEWRSGDKVAQYGLTGLVVGGGAALAAKSGLLAKFWKLLLIPVIAVASFFKKLTGGKKE